MSTLAWLAISYPIGNPPGNNQDTLPSLRGALLTPSPRRINLHFLRVDDLTECDSHIRATF